MAEFFDAAGNQNRIRNYAATYDGENRLRTVGTPSGMITNDYDGEGRRVRKSSGVEVVCFVYDIFGRVVAEYGGSLPSVGRKFLTVDPLGSTRVVTNAAGEVAARHDYFAFGEEYPAGINNRTTAMGYQPPISQRKKFTGKERDTESGLDYFCARYLSSTQGRFTSPDPLSVPGLKKLGQEKFLSFLTQPQNWNAYAYTNNNPLNRLDPDGYLTIIIPGTWNSHTRWESSSFKENVERYFGEKAIVLNNPNMALNHDARRAASIELLRMINEHEFAQGEKLNIITHSHGGNVAFHSTLSPFARYIDTLITLGAPIRPDYQPNMKLIGNLINVYSKGDYVQTIGIDFDRNESRGAPLPMR